MLGLGDAAGPGIASTADAGHRALLPFPDVRSLSRLPPFAWKASRRPSLRLWSSPGTGHPTGAVASFTGDAVRRINLAS
jgi:hypothetical protein